MNTKHYEQEKNIFQLAANLSEKIIQNHAYQDGNKRTALIAASMFLKINGYQLHEASLAHNANVDDGITRAHVAVAMNRWDKKRLGEYYEFMAVPLENTTQEVASYRNGAEKY
ncbi:hypothetical protein MMC25_006001 [Agyrium rufum]|nr:hypothetical protein [Agyrium rufum]